MKRCMENVLGSIERKKRFAVLAGAVILAVGLGALTGCAVGREATEKEESIAGTDSEAPHGEQEAISSDDSQSQAASDIPQNGQIYGYVRELFSDSVTIDRQIWVTSESEDWKPEYDEAAGFEVVDAESEAIIYPLHKDCTYSVLEEHQGLPVEIDKEEFKNYLLEMEYAVLWVMELKDGQIKSIAEQYRP